MKTRYIPVRMDEEMEKELDAMKQALGVRSRSEVVRLAVKNFATSTRPFIRKELVEELNQMRRAFTNAGNNLNQVAIKLNTNRQVRSEEVLSGQEELKRSFGELVRFFWRVEDELRRR
jgi:hypothetical protein